MEGALRCTHSGCSCSGFAPGFKGCKRTCSSCQHGWISHALDKVLLDDHLPAEGSSSSSLMTSSSTSRIRAAYDLASLILFGTSALPVRLKIVLDALLSIFSDGERTQLLQGFGWTLQDFSRGYIHKDPYGNRLIKWTIVNKDEESLVMQHFLKFGETKSLAEGFLREDQEEQARQSCSSTSMDKEHRDKKSSKASSHALLLDSAASDIMKFIERANKESQSLSLRSSSQSKQSSNNNAIMNNSMNSNTHQNEHNVHQNMRPFPSSFDSLSVPREQRKERVSPTQLLPPTSSSHRHQTSPEAGHEGVRSSSSPNNNRIRGSTSPLTRLAHHGIQPFDFRKMFSGSKGLEGQDANELFRASKKHHAQQLAMMGFPAGTDSDNNVGQKTPSGIIPASSSMSINSDDQSMSEGSGDEDTSEGAMNLSVGGYDSKERNRKSSNPMKRRWNPMVMSSLVTNPQTGKRRVQCHACFKTFCDKGALKIHFSAVHLREMHKCTVDGCTMMFSSRRSRNRHSANPNPKLHSSSLRRKLNPHDGRTSQPYPNALAMGPPSPSSLLEMSSPDRGMSSSLTSGLMNQSRLMLDQQRYEEFEKIAGNILTGGEETTTGNNGSSSRVNDMRHHDHPGDSFRSSSCSPCPSYDSDPSSSASKRLNSRSLRHDRLVSDSNGHHEQRSSNKVRQEEERNHDSQAGQESEANRSRKRKSANPTKFSVSTPTAVSASNAVQNSDDEYSSDDSSNGTFLDGSRLDDTNGLNDDSEDDDEDDSLQELINLQRQKALRKMMEYNELKRLNREASKPSSEQNSQRKDHDRRHLSNSIQGNNVTDRHSSPSPDHFPEGRDHVSPNKSLNNNHHLHQDRKDSRSLSTSSSSSVSDKKDGKSLDTNKTSSHAFQDQMISHKMLKQHNQEQNHEFPPEFPGQTRSDAENPLRHLESLSMGFNNLISSNGQLRNASLFGGNHGLPFPAVPPGLQGLSPFSMPPTTLSGSTAPSNLLASPSSAAKRTPTSSSTSSNNNNFNDSLNDVRDGDDGNDSNDSSDRRGSGQEDEYSMFRDTCPGIDIPVDKDNPRRCVACGKIFQNHFGVKTHYQNVHLKLMHKCTVDGCNAAFPSKRSRDRHSSNLNLHRKLLSTHSDKGIPYGFVGDKNSFFPYSPATNLRDEFMSRFYDPQGLPLNLGDLYQGRLPGFGPEGLLAAAAGFPGSLGVPGFGPPFPMGLPQGVPGMMIPRPGDENPLREDSPASSVGSSHSTPRSSDKNCKKRKLSHDEVTHGSSFEALSAARDKMLLDHERLRQPENNNSENTDKNAQQTKLESNVDEDTDVAEKEDPQNTSREEDFDENISRESSPSTSQENTANAATAPISCPISC